MKERKKVKSRKNSSTRGDVIKHPTVETSEQKTERMPKFLQKVGLPEAFRIKKEE
jgi:hypothetical protein